MTLFQWLAGGLMLLLVCIEIYLQAVGRARRLIGGIRLVVWAAAAALIFFPAATNFVAQFLSIGRGADVVLYGTAIAFLLSFFYMIHALERQREQLTCLVRNIAISSPLHVPRTPATADPAETSAAGDETEQHL